MTKASSRRFAFGLAGWFLVACAAGAQGAAPPNEADQVPPEPAEEAALFEALEAGGAIGLDITSPATGWQVVPGTAVEIEVKPFPGVNVESVAVVGPGTVASDEEAPFEVDLELPLELVGPFEVMAIGKGPAGEMFASRVLLLEAVPAARLIALDLTPKESFLFVPGLDRSLRATGVYDDGVRRDITEVGTEFISLNEEIVKVSADGVLTPTKVGITTVLARNGDVQDGVTVNVVENPRLISREDFEGEAGESAAAPADQEAPVDPDRPRESGGEECVPVGPHDPLCPRPPPSGGGGV